MNKIGNTTNIRQNDQMHQTHNKMQGNKHNSMGSIEKNDSKEHKHNDKHMNSNDKIKTEESKLVGSGRTIDIKL
ncbi:MAG: hypothetical protein WBA54_14610 [Acidaminobacteraceae bacterium]